METPFGRIRLADVPSGRLCVPYPGDMTEPTSFDRERVVAHLRESSTIAYERYADLRAAMARWYDDPENPPPPMIVLTFDARRLRLATTHRTQEHGALEHLAAMRAESHVELDGAVLPNLPGIATRVLLQPDEGFSDRARSFRRAVEDDEGVRLLPPLPDPEPPVLLSEEAELIVLRMLTSHGIEPTPDEIDDVLRTYGGPPTSSADAARAVRVSRAGARRAPSRSGLPYGRFDPNALMHEPHDSSGGWLAFG